jgi:hypothetical protein
VSAEQRFVCRGSRGSQIQKAVVTFVYFVRLAQFLVKVASSEASVVGLKQLLQDAMRYQDQENDGFIVGDA